MRIDVITLFPEIIAGALAHGIPARALDRRLLTLHTWNPRDATHDPHRTVDDRPYGGGPGMVMKVQPLCDILARARAVAGGRGHVIYLSPQGRLLNQAGVRELAARPHLILIAGRYEGVDERFVAAAVDEEWSIGDYVLSGGEFAALVMIDAIVRLLPGALGDAESAAQDSFMAGLLDCPHYTRPEISNGVSVPEVLLSGDHDAIRRWRLQQSLGRTWLRRPDLLAQRSLNHEEQRLLDEFIQIHQPTSAVAEPARALS
ncbi:MAG: tRNA (guanosine(37)-N1)-methyltransferase TrmD [Gammaproteobacteria bacterium]